MELKIKSQKEKPFLGRKEFFLEGKSETTPSRIQLKEELVRLTNSPAEMVVIKRVKQQFGKQDFEVEAHVYDSEKSLKAFEQEKKKKAEGEAK